jgi:hypothetical protein
MTENCQHELSERMDLKQKLLKAAFHSLLAILQKSDFYLDVVFFLAAQCAH